MVHAEPDSLPPGTLIGGQYRLERLIGKGGFGAVFQATDMQRGSAAAVKVLSRDALDQSGGLGRFRREADLASRLTHKHTVRVLGAGEDAMGWLFIAFELLVGRSVEQALVVEGAMAPERAAAIVSDALSALDEAHKVGIIHRDLKPANLFLADGPKGELVKVLDFGIAKSVKPGTLAGLTRVGSAVGTPIYMAPEQVLGQDVGPRSDLFSLGIVLADMVLGVSPYGPDPNALTVVTERIGGKPVPLPPAIASSRMGLIITRATQADPARRFQSASEMRSALAVFAPTMRMDGSPSRDVRSPRVIGRTGPPDPALASAKTEAGEITAAGSRASYGVPSSSGPAPAHLASTAPSSGPMPGVAPPASGVRISGMSAPPSSLNRLAATADEIPIAARSVAPRAARDEPPPATIRDPSGARPAKRSRAGLVIALVALVVVAAGITVAVLYINGYLDDLLGRKPPKKRPSTATAAPAPLDASTSRPASPSAAPLVAPVPSATSFADARASSAPASTAPRKGRVRCPGIDARDIHAVMPILQRHALDAKLKVDATAAAAGNFYISLLGDTDSAFLMRPEREETFEPAFAHQRWEDNYALFGFGARSAIFFMHATSATDAALTELCAEPGGSTK